MVDAELATPVAEDRKGQLFRWRAFANHGRHLDDLAVLDFAHARMCGDSEIVRKAIVAEERRLGRPYPTGDDPELRKVVLSRTLPGVAIFFGWWDLGDHCVDQAQYALAIEVYQHAKAYAYANEASFYQRQSGAPIEFSRSEVLDAEKAKWKGTGISFPSQTLQKAIDRARSCLPD
ncbi:MAG: hypothetical protein AAB152_16105 [Candidatus Coatesbacteria bacterium]